MRAAKFLYNAQKQVVQAGKTGINAIDLNLSNKGISQISIAVKAGTRHEIADNLAHTVAECKGNTSESHTEFLQIQQLERAGAEYSHTVGRDHIVYTLKCGPRLASEMLSDVVLPGLFCSHDWQWEITEKEHYMSKKLEHMSEKEKMIDQLFSVSFKSGGLEKSNIPAAYRLGKGAMRRTDFMDWSSFYWPIPSIDDRRVQAEEVKLYKDLSFTHDNITIFTSGFSELEAQAINDSVAAYTAPGGARQASASAFVSGESRTSNNASEPSGFLGFPGAAAGADNQAAYIVLATALSGDSFSHEGAGLLAVPINGQPEATLEKMANLSNNDIELAKEIASNNQSFENDTFDGAVSNLLNGSFNASVDNVSVPAVKALAASLAKGPKSMVVSGNLNGVAFLADL